MYSSSVVKLEVVDNVFADALLRHLVLAVLLLRINFFLFFPSLSSLHHTSSSYTLLHSSIDYSQLEKWWEHYAYLSSREPMATLGNMVGPLFAINDVWPPWSGTQLERSSVFIWVALQYFQNARRLVWIFSYLEF